jgi:glycosyltransferase involved in cell wall biosynthesis
MKIIVLQDRLRSGGTERHSILLSREFAEAGHRAELVTFRPGGALAGTVSSAHRCLQPFDTGIDWLAPGLTGRILAGSPDIVLCMGKTANCFACRIQRRAAALGLATKVVATLRAGDRLPWFYTCSVRRACHAVTNSDEAAERLVAAHGIERGAVSVIHNSLVFPESAGGRDEALRSDLGAGTGSTVLLSVAMFRPPKNQRALLEIAAGLPGDWDWRLWLVGDGPERGRCEALCRRLGLGRRVSFLGFRADPGPYYRSADIAVHASSEEALSNFLIEAQAHGLPAVACRALGIRECFVEGSTGWMVEQGDHAGFRSALALLAADTPAVRAARSQTARAFARRSFDPGRQVKAYLALFESLLSEKPQAPRP